MDDKQEEELLMHVAAGTDLLTALAAVPREDNRKPRPQLESSFASVCGTVLTVAILLALVLLWLFA
jgi:hypothetical protein